MLGTVRLQVSLKSRASADDTGPLASGARVNGRTVPYRVADASSLTASRAAVARGVGYVVALVGVAVLATALHRHGHTQGDDFALYLRQARSIFDGDIGGVIDDNRFAVLNSDPAFSPIGYPWVWPLVLSPFVHLWGLDYDRLKLVTVALFCTWLALLFGIVRRRLGRWPALGCHRVIATSPVFLLHTDQLISEYAFFVAIAVVIWWCDRIHRSSDLSGRRGRSSSIARRADGRRVQRSPRSHRARRRRRVAAADRLSRRTASARTPRRFVERVRASWLVLLVPYASFVASVVVFQLLLPTGAAPRQRQQPGATSTTGWASIPATLTRQLNLGEHPLLGIAILVVAVDRGRHRRSAATDARHPACSCWRCSPRSSSARTSVRWSGTGCR